MLAVGALMRKALEKEVSAVLSRIDVGGNGGHNPFDGRVMADYVAS